MIEQTIPWVLQTHGYKHCATPWRGTYKKIRGNMKIKGNPKKIDTLNSLLLCCFA
jgi:hypothetical protein